MINDSNLAQCEWCGFVTDWDDVPTARDITGEIVQCCENCNEGESYVSYDPAKAIIREQRIAAEAAKSDAT